MIRITSKPEGEATLESCVAHRCQQHAAIDQVLHEDVDGPPENLAECAYCVADRVVKTLVAENIFPVVVAFEKAEGQLRLMGVHANPATRPLFALLEALTEKAGEDDFKVHAQNVIADTLQAPGPERPQ